MYGDKIEGNCYYVFGTIAEKPINLVNLCMSEHRLQGYSFRFLMVLVFLGFINNTNIMIFHIYYIYVILNV